MLSQDCYWPLAEVQDRIKVYTEYPELPQWQVEYLRQASYKIDEAMKLIAEML